MPETYVMPEHLSREGWRPNWVGHHHDGSMRMVPEERYEPFELVEVDPSGTLKTLPSGHIMNMQENMPMEMMRGEVAGKLKEPKPDLSYLRDLVSACRDISKRKNGQPVVGRIGLSSGEWALWFRTNRNGDLWRLTPWNELNTIQKETSWK